MVLDRERIGDQFRDDAYSLEHEWKKLHYHLFKTDSSLSEEVQSIASSVAEMFNNAARVYGRAFRIEEVSDLSIVSPDISQGIKGKHDEMLKKKLQYEFTQNCWAEYYKLRVDPEPESNREEISSKCAEFHKNNPDFTTTHMEEMFDEWDSQLGEEDEVENAFAKFELWDLAGELRGKPWEPDPPPTPPPAS
jgi:hypothetical protein